MIKLTNADPLSQLMTAESLFWLQPDKDKQTKSTAFTIQANKHMNTRVHTVGAFWTLKELFSCIMMGTGRRGITHVCVWQWGKTRGEMSLKTGVLDSVLCWSSCLLDNTHTHIRTWWNNARNASFILLTGLPYEPQLRGWMVTGKAGISQQWSWSQDWAHCNKTTVTL